MLYLIIKVIYITKTHKTHASLILLQRTKTNNMFKQTNKIEVAIFNTKAFQ